MSAIVYLVTNRLNGKRYVGATSMGLSRRRYHHEHAATGKRAKDCRHFHFALAKYGAASFDWTVIAHCADLKEALREEVQLIADLKPEYNLTAGGEGLIGYKPTPEVIARIVAKTRGQKRTPEQRERMGAARRGKPFSETHRQNLRLAQLGKKQSPELIAKRLAGRIGKPLTAEHRAKISDALMGHPCFGTRQRKEASSVAN